MYPPVQILYANENFLKINTVGFASQCRNLLQSYNKIYSLVLVNNKHLGTYIIGIELRFQNKSIHLCSIAFNKDIKTTEWRKQQCHLQMVLGKLNIHMQKNGFESLY
jgi:hypothetical protein